MAEAPLRSVRGGKLLVLAVVVSGGLFILGRVATELYVESLWYREAGYAPVFFRRLLWFWGLRLLAVGVVTLALVASLRLVARTLGGIQIKRRFGNLEISEQLPRSYLTWGILAASLLLGAWFGGSVQDYTTWAVLVALQGVEWGVVEPVFGMDASFYVFVLPLLRWSVTFLMILVFLVFTVCMGGYAATGGVRWGRGGVVMGNQPRIHLGALVATFILLLAVRFWLARYMLLLAGNSAVQGIFGFADAEARLPAHSGMALITTAAAGLVMWGVWRNRLVPVASGVGVVLVGSLLGVQLYPSLVQRFRVEPNELERETPWIEHNLRFTRLGFGLDGMARELIRYDRSEPTDWASAREQFDGLPVWSDATLLANFREMETRYPYYHFPTVDIDRYASGEDGTLVPVAVSVREIDPDAIPDPNWQNLHLRDLYIAGMGAVAASAARRTGEGRPPMYLVGIPPEFAGGPDAPRALSLRSDQIFFGTRLQRYAIINPSSAGPEETIQGVAGTDFPEGILLDRFLRKLALSWRFRDASLLLASEVTGSSRLVFRRQVAERAREIAPFFSYPESPYPVISEGKVVWILEGFTATSFFPLSKPHDVESRAPASYVRNSVKVTVDALTGETRFYALPEPDPLRDAYGQAFPGLLRPIEEMPDDLRSHLRYPKELLKLQATVLLQYHQETAPRFHGQQDVWAPPKELFQSNNPVDYPPEYGIYRLPGQEKETFNVTTAFVPLNRQNLTALLAGRLDPDGTPKLVLYDVPVDDQAPGPRQVEVLVEQEPEISQQLTLWRSGGSTVWSGHLHLVPVGNRIVYIEPIFLATEAQAIPALHRFVVSDGSRVSMEPSLEEAIAVLSGEPPALHRPLAGATLPGEEVRPGDALDLLREAESALRAGDWQGFGRALQDLRGLLERLSAGGPS